MPAALGALDHGAVEPVLEVGKLEMAMAVTKHVAYAFDGFRLDIARKHGAGAGRLVPPPGAGWRRRARKLPLVGRQT
jgi:hypothetical protein